MSILTALALLLAAQAQAQPPPPDDGSPSDVVVEGYRLRKPLDSRVQPPSMVSTVTSRVRFEFSERVAKCAARHKLSSLARLSAVVDGEINSARQRLAQDRLVRIYITCSESPSLLSLTTPPRSVGAMGAAKAAFDGDYIGIGGAAEAAPLGLSPYDRGAFVIEALKTFAPDLTLTRREVADPEVRARFNRRETVRNRFRLPADARYFEVAVCMVRVEPRLAVRLALSEGPARLGDVQEALIDRARICVGGAKRVQVDPTQFRIYIADAVYRWAVAAKGVDSLIPAA